MAAQTTNAMAGLMQKMGKQVLEAHKEFAGAEVKYSNMGELPAGIQNGIAQLVDIKVDKIADGKDNAGEYYFYAAGIVQEPETFTDKAGNVHNLKGMRTSIIESLFDTPSKSRKTFKEHWAWMYNELGKLGIETDKLDPQNMEATFQAMAKAGIHFKFRTYSFPKRKPGEPGYDPKYADREPQVFHDWQGAVEYKQSEAGSGVQDDTAPAATAVTATKPPANNKPTAKPTPAPAAKPDTSADMGDDYTQLATLADNGDDSAGAKLTAACEQRGIDPSAYDNWTAVAAVLSGSGVNTEAAPATEAAADDTPAVGQVYDYLVPKKGPGGKVMGKATKPIDVKITAVDTKAKTVDLLSLVDNKTTWTKVAWTDLGAE